MSNTDTTAQIPSQVEKVRKILDKAASTTNENERDTFLSHAARLAAKHSITDAMLAMAKGSEREAPISKKLPVPEKYSKMYGFLYSALARSYGASSIMHPKPGHNKKGYEAATVVAFQSDLEMIELLFLGLAPSLAKAFNRKGSQSYKMNLAMSFISGVETRIKDERRKAVQENDAEMATEDAGSSSEASEAPKPPVGTAMVLQDRSEVVNDSYREMFPRIKNLSTSIRYDYNARRAGTNMARNADLNTRQRLNS
jgi:hypothetical protein